MVFVEGLIVRYEWKRGIKNGMDWVSGDVFNWDVEDCERNIFWVVFGN